MTWDFSLSRRRWQDEDEAEEEGLVVEGVLLAGGVYVGASRCG